MPKIHGLVYVAVGLFVSIFSWKFNYQKLIFFFYVGLIFILVGIIKLLFELVKFKKEKIKPSHQAIQKHQSHHIKYCSQCGNPARIHDKFCSKCGARI